MDLICKSTTTTPSYTRAATAAKEEKTVRKSKASEELHDEDGNGKKRKKSESPVPIDLEQKRKQPSSPAAEEFALRRARKRQVDYIEETEALAQKRGRYFTRSSQVA